MTVEYTLLALAVPALLAAAGFAVWTRLRTRRMLDTLGKMLDDAIRGEFRESLYDESRLSALETRMAHYLSASAVSAKNLAEEKDAIKTLIGDISHQTKTPIANLLLYAQLLEEQDLPPESREYASALEHQAEKKKINLIFTGEDTRNIRGVYRLLYEIFYNLADNAVKYTGECGRVHVDLRETPEGIVWSVEDNGAGVCFHVLCFNAQPGVTIDYATGDSWAEGENTSSDGEITYILNTSSLRFHEPDCAGAARIAPANRQETTANRELLLAQGYQPCGTCKP